MSWFPTEASGTDVEERDVGSSGIQGALSRRGGSARPGGSPKWRSGPARRISATKHVEDIEDIWVRYFEAEHHLHWIIPPATEPEDS